MSLRTLFVVLFYCNTMVTGQLFWWPFAWSKTKEVTNNQSGEMYHKQVEAITTDSSHKQEYRQYPPLPWIFTGSPNPSGESNWFLQYFKKGLQSFHMPTHVPGGWLPPTPSIPVPQKLITPVVSNVVTNLGPNCDVEKTCTLQIKSYETQDPFFRYVYGHTSTMDPLLQNIFDKTRSSMLELPLTQDNVMPPEVVTLSVSLMQATDAKMTLIVGVFTGLSVIAAALATPKDGRILAVENPDYLKYWQQVGYKFVKDTSLLDKIIIQGATRVPQYLDSLAKTQPGSFDFIVLDDYDIENYKIDYTHCYELLRPKGVMIINNVLNSGKVLSGQQYRDVGTRTVDDLNSKLKSDWRIYANLLPIGNGVMLITKK